MKSRGIPRPLEAALALSGLLVVSPVLAAAAAAVRLSSSGPVLFRQRRVGQGGRVFMLVKFRTMRAGSSGAQVTTRRDTRVTGVGRLLRKLKIDELPELWNVVKGDMALVGPRPEVERFVDRRDPLWEEVFRVRPGLTDPVTLLLRNEEELLAQVDGDAEAFYKATLLPLKLEGYVTYLRRRTFCSDVRTLFETVLAIVLPSRVPVPSVDGLAEALSAANLRESTASGN